FSLLALMTNLGVVMGKDLFTIFIFFELMGILSYVLIIHTEKEEAFHAGKKYLIMTITGGLILLAGIFIYFNLTGTLDLYAHTITYTSKNTFRIFAAFFLITGFGVKAGMVPLHVWLPDANPAAPTPASAILSGVMIKAGAYGILRVTQLPFFSRAKEFSFYMSYTVIWVGIITMFVGVILALLQSNAKRLLAYHSISQMGYILMGIGCAVYLGTKGAIGLAGSVYHIINHALFKSSLFFAAGAVYLQTKENNLYNLGGLRKKMPYLTVFTIIAACGISGIPLFNGYISKTILHHAIIESYNLKHDIWLKAAEIIFIITSAGTVCSFIKFTGLTFFGTSKLTIEIKEPPFWINLPPVILAITIIFLGLFPNYSINNFFLPVLDRYYNLEELSLLKHLSFWDMHNLSGIIIPVAGGTIVFLMGMRFGLFHLHIPAQIGFDFWYLKIAILFENIIYKGYEI
ncbi:proton-conducting membrane transporter, partial [Candidatus Desantisbacteria bacterium]|nr:proton-conducting membrane transporter [Candidatus Desantisbacteria bacterium]